MENVMKHLTQVWRCACLYRMKQYEPLGIGMYQDSYLVAVCECPGITQEGIAKRIFVHKSNVARQICSLEEKGFVSREPDPADKRNLLVYPTQKALSALPVIRRVRAAWAAQITQGFSAEEAAALSRALERLAENAAAALAACEEGT